jgi:hypothetical protein
VDIPGSLSGLNNVKNTPMGLESERVLLALLILLGLGWDVLWI